MTWKMTEKQMLDKLEATRRASQQANGTYYALGNGEHIFCTVNPALKEAKEKDGYWLVAIFENGHRVEA